MCFILPPLILDQIHQEISHISLVVSPLISLMQDQRADLATHGIKSVCVTHEASRAELAGLSTTDASVIFTSPEALRLPLWRNMLLKEDFQNRMCLIACDEAHCISEWGGNFRPEYREIAQLRSFTDRPMVALTATATDKVQTDIFTYLLLDEKDTLRVGRVPDRPNIFIAIQKDCKHTIDTELAWIAKLFKSCAPGSMKKTIIFCRSYTATYNVWSWLIQDAGEGSYVGEQRASNRCIEMFHASTETDTKAWILSEFKKATSKIRILVCTIAFGMGIQIPDIQYVIHWGAPRSVLSYFQEIGRAGRDGRPATAIMYPLKRTLMKSVTDDGIREVVGCTDTCLRQLVLKKLMTKSMNPDDIPKATACPDLSCRECACEHCRCCNTCKNACMCMGNCILLHTS